MGGLNNGKKVKSTYDPQLDAFEEALLGRLADLGGVDKDTMAMILTGQAMQRCVSAVCAGELQVQHADPKH